MTDAPLSLAILAGGAATRLGGRDKGLEPLLGRPLVAWIVEALAPSAASVVVVANRNLAEYARHAPVVSDAIEGYAGPLAGVAAALAHASAPLVMTVPVDCPDPPRDLAERLRHGMRGGEGAVVAHDGERRQPLFALYRRELAQSAAEAAAVGQGVWQWQQSIGAREVDFADRRRQFHNLNTADDFAAYADALRSRS